MANLRARARARKSAVRHLAAEAVLLDVRVHGESPPTAPGTAGPAAAPRDAPAAPFGSIQVGKWADLVLLEADPLDDNRNTRKIWQVIQGGRIVDRTALEP
jgi:cytosine/adenosine deaminase-related metal-dependent hydrolase